MTIEEIICKIAKKNYTTPEHVRKEMEYALEEAQKRKDPKAQARWAAIPGKGEKITLENFITYTPSVGKLIS